MNAVTHHNLLASRTQLHALKLEAKQANDLDLVAICDRALDGDEQAHAQATQVILDALGNDGVSLGTVVSIADMLGLVWCWRDDGSVRIKNDVWLIEVFVDACQLDESPSLMWSVTHWALWQRDESGSWESIQDIVSALTDLGADDD